MSDFHRFVTERADALAESIVQALDAITRAFEEFDEVRCAVGDPDAEEE